MNNLSETLKQMKMTADLAPCGIGLYEAETRAPVFFNRAYFELIGCTQEEYEAGFAGESNFPNPPSDAAARQNLLEFSKLGETENQECSFVRGDGQRRWVKIDTSAVTVDGQAYVFASFADITKEKEIREHLTMVVENTNNAVSILRLTASAQKLIYANDRFYDLMGIDFNDRSANIEPCVRAAISDVDLERFRQTLAQAADSEQMHQIEHQLTRADGTTRWVNTRIRVVRQETTDTRILLSIMTDITEKKEIEIKVALEQHRFRLVVDEMDAAVFEWNLKTGSFYSSAAYQKYSISRMNAQDILSNCGPAELVHPDDQELLQAFFSETRSGKPRAETTLRLKMLDGTYRWCRMLGFFYRDTAGTPSHTIGVILDVHVEHERSFMMDRLLNAMPGGVGIFVFAKTMLCNYYSDGFAKLAGLSRAEMDQKIADNTVLTSLIAPVDYLAISPILAQRTAQGLPLNLTYRYVYRDGSIRWLHLSAEKMGEQDGAPVYYCVFTTPTEETALYRSLAEDSAVGIFVAERATRRILYVNAAADNLCGFPRTTDKTGLSVVEFKHLWGLSPLLAQAQVDSLSFDTYSEFHLERNQRYLAIKAKAVFWNETDSYILYITDETLEHENRLQLQKLIDEVPGGIGVYDIRNGKTSLTYLNNAYYEMLNAPRESRKQFYNEKIFDAVHPDDKAAMKEVVTKLISGQNRANALHRVRNAAGEWIWLKFEAAAVERTEGHIRVYAAISNCDAMVRTQQKMQETRKREQALLASIPGGVAIYRLKKDGRFLLDYASEGLAKMCGYEDCSEFFDYLKENVMVNVLPEDVPALQAAAAQCVQERKPISIMYHIHTKNGPDILNRLDANLIDDSDGLQDDDLALWYAVHTLVSRDSRRAMREQHRYRGLMNTLDMVLLEWEKDSGFYASEKFQEYALSQQDYRKILSNSADTSVVHPDDLPALKEFFGLQGKMKTRSSTTLRMLMRDGSYRWTEMLGFYEYAKDGHLNRVIGILRDIDKERIEQNERLRRALQEAESASQAKTSFLSRVSHDMRTPLNGILGLTALMKDISTDSHIIQDLNQLELSGQYLLTLINDTLDVSRIESNRLELHPTVCDSRVVFNNVQRLTRPGMEQKNIRLEMKADNLPFTYLYVDEGRLEQIAMNILGNAVKFSPEGSVIHVLAETLSIRDGIVTDHFVVQDSGCGMSKDFLPHLFEPFSQENAATTNSNQGTGLGMSITKRLVELMNGTINVTSEVNQGTRFDVTLQLPIATEEQVAAWQRAQNTHVIHYNLRGKRILLCEDHPLNTKIATRLLEREGLLVEHAEDGRIGVTMFTHSDPGYYDAILMDIRMPVMDGIDAAIAIRALDRPDSRRIPIIAMTANALDDDVKRTHEAGMDAHLSKPIDPARLYGVLEQFLNPELPYLRPRILVVDDAAVNRAAIRAALEPDYEVFEAESGEQALAILNEKNGMDALLTDLQMPGMGGAELIRHVRANKDYRHMVVIANTQHDNPGQEERLLALGANDFIYKPSNPDVVRIRVRNALHKG